MRHPLALPGAACLLLGLTAPALALPSGFAKTRIISGLTKPTSMAFAPDGRIFVTERGTTADGVGKVRVIKNGSLLGTPFVSINVDNTSVNPDERGLLGLAFDPNFASNGFVYVYYTVPGSSVHNRVSRFTASGDVAVSGSEKQLLNLTTLSAGVHNGGGIHFGADGKLYIASGDNRTNVSTNLGDYLGKIIRINADGTVPSDNPFFDSADGITSKDRIWAYGFRNPYSFNVQPGTGRIFVNDVGESTWEEIDDLVKGKDYGWRGGSTDGDSTAWFKYDHNTGKCITGGNFYNPPSAPGTYSNFVGQYFYGDYCSGWIRVINPSNKSVTVFDTGLTTPVDVDVGSDGNVYFLSYANGEIWKVTTTSTVSQALVVSSTGFTINEGSSGSFTIQLAKAPSANVSVALTRSSGDGESTASPSALTFTTSNWSTPQRVTITAGQDSDSLNESALFSITSSGLTTQKVTVNVLDDENTGPKTLISLPTQGAVVHGSSVDYYGGSNLDGSTAKAQFFIDGVLKYTDVGPGHYHYLGSHGSWDTTLFTEGTHTLKLSVFTTAGVVGSHQITMSIDNLPSPWNHKDVGAVAAAGGASQASGVWTVKGSGADIWNAADEGQFVYKQLSGDGEVRARVTGVQNTNSFAKAGVMMRESSAAGSTNAYMALGAGGTILFQHRNATGATSASTNVAGFSAPLWVRLKRAGTTFTGYRSSDGSTWTQIGSTNITMASDILIGLAVTSHNDGVVCTSTFDNVGTVGTTSGASSSALSLDGDDTTADPTVLGGTEDTTVDDHANGGCGGFGEGKGSLSSVLLLGLGWRLGRARRRRR